MNAQDWMPSFEQLFAEHTIHSVLEFGEGAGTRWLLERAKLLVTSVEICAHVQHEAWAKRCRDWYSGEPQWHQVILDLPPSLIELELKAMDGRYPDIGRERREVQGLAGLGWEHTYDLIFVDPGIHLRAALVNELFGASRIIAAHDTNVPAKVYGWDTILAPRNYEAVRYREDGLGTTFWVRK